MHENGRIRNPKTVLKTFRFSIEIVSALENEAKKEGLTIGTLLSSILAKHFEWDTKAMGFGYAPVYKPFLADLIQSADDKTLGRIGQRTCEEWKEMAEFWFQDASPDAILEFLTMRSKYVPYVQIQIKKQGSDYTIVYKHDLGPKWGIAIASALDRLVRKEFQSQPAVDTGEAMVMVRFSTSARNSPT